MCAAMALAMPAGFAQQAQTQAPRARSANAMGSTGGYLGVGLMDVDSAKAKALKLNEERGAAITLIFPGTPAEKAGLKVNDVILEYDGQRVQGMEQLTRMVRESVAGRAVKLGVWRNGAMETITATIEARREVTIMTFPTTPEAPEVWSEKLPPGVNWPQETPWPPMDIPQIVTINRNTALGVECESLGNEQQFAEFFGVKDGLLVKMVTGGSVAERAGIKAGDVIVKVDDARVGTMRELSTALRSAHSKSTVPVTVVRNKKEVQVTVTLDAMRG
jgi:serine protease Do